MTLLRAMRELERQAGLGEPELVGDKADLALPGDRLAEKAFELAKLLVAGYEYFDQVRAWARPVMSKARMADMPPDSAAPEA